LREGFLELFKIAKIKFKEGMTLQTMASVIFLRFYCPTIIFPVKFGLIEEDKMPKSFKIQKALRIVSKMMQTLSNGGEFEPGREHSPIIDKFVSSKIPIINQFIGKLMDEKKIKKHRAIVDASKLQKYTNTVKRQAKRSLRNYLQQFSEDSNVVMERDQVINSLKELCFSEGWKESASLGNIKAFQKKIPGSIIVMSKCVIPIEVPLKYVFYSLRNFEAEDLLGDSSKISILQNYSENHCDMRYLTSPPFPLTKRDFIVVRHCYYDERMSIISMRSINRSDYPPQKGIIRGVMYNGGYILEPSSDRTTTLSFITHTDIKTKLPVWLVNFNSVSFLKQYSKFRDFIEGKTSHDEIEVSLQDDDFSVDE